MRPILYYRIMNILWWERNKTRYELWSSCSLYKTKPRNYFAIFSKFVWNLLIRLYKLGVHFFFKIQVRGVYFVEIIHVLNNFPITTVALVGWLPSWAQFARRETWPEPQRICREHVGGSEGVKWFTRILNSNFCSIICRNENEKDIEDLKFKSLWYHIS